MLLQLSAVEGGERADAAVRRHVGRRHEVGDVAVVEVRGEEVLRRRLVLPRGQVGKAVRAVQPRQNSDVALLTLDAGTCSEKGSLGEEGHDLGNDMEVSLVHKFRLEDIEKYGRWSGKRNCNSLSEKSGVLRALLT